MVTIEKRADFYEKRCVEQANALGWSELPRPSQSYIVGAKEQRENGFRIIWKFPKMALSQRRMGKTSVGRKIFIYIKEYPKQPYFLKCVIFIYEG